MGSHKGTLRIFDGAVAVVTGGASGIGRALAEKLVKRGAEVVLADLQIELAKKVASDIRAAGGKAQTVEVDVSDYSAVEALVQSTVERTGRLDYMFNNAGIVVAGEVRDYGIEDWDRVIDVNLRGVTNGIQAAYQVMLKQGFGHIVNTASVAGLWPFTHIVGYTATKHAVVGLSKSLRAEAAPAGIRVSVVCPGLIRTPIWNGGKYGKILVDIPFEKMKPLAERLWPMNSDIFASKTLDAVARNKAIIVVPGWWKLAWWLHRVSPSLGIFLARKVFQKIQRDLSRLRE